MSHGYDAVRIAVGLILLITAGLKAHQLSTEPVLATNIFESRWFLIGLVEFELFFGLWLLSGLFPSATRKVAILCFSGFAAASLYKALFGYASCGCFGAVSVNPWYSATLDFSLLVGLCAFRARLSTRPSEINSFRALHISGVIAAWLIFGGAIGLAMCVYSPVVMSDAGDVLGDGTVVLEPGSWVGKRLPVLDYIDDGHQLTTGTWTVVLYHHNCQRCSDAIRELVSSHEARSLRQLALVELPPYATETCNFPIGSLRVVYARLADSREWFVETPVVFLVRDGIVSAMN